MSENATQGSERLRGKQETAGKYDVRQEPEQVQWGGQMPGNNEKRTAAAALLPLAIVAACAQKRNEEPLTHQRPQRASTQSTDKRS